jgi:hypothetical protein
MMILIFFRSMENIRMIRCISQLIMALFMASGLFAHASDIMLYDSSAGTLPGNQPWLLYAQDTSSGGTASASLVTGGTNFSTNNPGRGGWSNTIPILNVYNNANFPTLSPTAGFALDWSMQVASETHNTNDRAGTSVILIGADNQGIELGFWSDQVWAQLASPLFTHGETAALDTSSSSVNYRLQIQGANYLLYADGNQILNGQTRSYAAFGSAPYTLSNYFFIGDNATSAGASTNFGSIRLTTPVPESSSLLLGVSGLLILVACRKRK